MAITEDGSLWAWGLNRLGQLGDGTDIDRHYPVKIMDNMASVSTNVGDIMYSAVTNTLIAALRTDGTLLTWGADIRDRDFGRPAGSDGPQSRRYLSAPIEVMRNVSDFSVGNGHIMAITSDNTLWGWGVNSRRQVSTSSNHIPSPVPVKNDVIAVSAGSRHTMAITSDGTLWGWGANWRRQKDDVIAVSAGGGYTMAITSDGTLWGWGGNRKGGLATEQQRNAIALLGLWMMWLWFRLAAITLWL